MINVQIFDPPMCCSTGICGPEVDPNIVQFAVLLSQLEQRGVAVERYNLGQQPMAFVQNPKVKALLETGGTEALPVMFWDGEIVMQGKYPDQSMTDPALARHPETGDPIRRVIVGGYGVLKSGGETEAPSSSCGRAPAGCCG